MSLECQTALPTGNDPPLLRRNPQTLEKVTQCKHMEMQGDFILKAQAGSLSLTLCLCVRCRVRGHVHVRKQRTRRSELPARRHRHGDQERRGLVDGHGRREDRRVPVQLRQTSRLVNRGERFRECVSVFALPLDTPVHFVLAYMYISFFIYFVWFVCVILF